MNARPSLSTRLLFAGSFKPTDCAKTLILLTLPLLLNSFLPASAEIVFSAELERASIKVDSLNSILDNALIIGNGDINALVWTEQGRPAMMLTKNDVWDARLDSKLDPPIPTLALIKQFAKNPTGGGNAALMPDGWARRGADSYHAHPYPCPRACAKLVIGAENSSREWRCIRALGSHNAWEARSPGAVMSIEGKSGASNGYRLDGVDLSTDAESKLRINIAGSGNARFYIDLMGPDGQVAFKTGWTETPVEPQDLVWKLPEGLKIAAAVLYTWTEDGGRAENHFRDVVFETGSGKRSLDLSEDALEPRITAGRLDIRRAVATVAGSDGIEVRALADRNVFLIRSPIQASLVPVASADTPDAVVGTEEGVSWLTQEMPADPGWPGMSYAVAVERRGDWHAVAIVTSREADDPRAFAVKLANETLAAGSREMIRRHESEWTSFWSRSGIKLQDQFLADTWYRNLYFLRCVTKSGVVAPGLFASLVNSSPAWHGDYHTNYNLQQTFWAAFNSNHPELAEPYAALMHGYLPRARWLCRKIFGFDGAYFPHVIFAYEPDPAHVDCPNGRQYIHHVWGYTMGVPAFTVQPVWWQYKYQPDRDFLRNIAYPLVRDVALFQVNFMDQCEAGPDGRVLLGPTVSPEHWGWTKNFERNMDSTFDIAMFRYIFNAAIEGAAVLECDKELVARWQGALRRLPAYPATGGDQPVVVDVRNAPPITYNIANPVVPVFPGDDIWFLSSAGERELFSLTVEKTRWNGNNSIYIMGVSRARLSLPGTKQWLSDEIKARLRPNQTITLGRIGAGFNNFGHYTEQFAASMAIGELLLQSVKDVVRVFPAWPVDEDAEFVRLRTQGGFLVSARQSDGRIVKLEIESTVGGRLRLFSPWPTVKADGQVLAPDSQGIVTLDTRINERFVFAGN